MDKDKDEVQLPLTFGEGEVYVTGGSAEKESWKTRRMTRKEMARLVDVDKVMRVEGDPRGNERFRQMLVALTGKGYELDEAIVGAWLALGHGGRGINSTSQLAKQMGISRKKLWEMKKRVAGEAAPLRAAFFNERLADVDAAVYKAAVSERGTASDRKLFYQIAGGAMLHESGSVTEQVTTGVQLGNAEAGSGGGWAEALKAAREEANG